MKGLQDMLRALAGYSVLVMLLGVAMAPAQAQTPVVRFEVERFEVEGDNPLSRARTEEVLAPFTGEHAGVDGLLAAADALERAIEDAGVSFQRVVLPPQSLQDGTVVLRVSVFTVARVEVEGAQHHSEANVRRSVPALREGETPDTGAIGRDLAVANRQAWKTTSLTFRESETEVEGLDATLEVRDRRPRMVWSGLDNTGNASTGPIRWSVGGSLGNLFERDHSVNASYTTSPGANRTGAAVGDGIWRAGLRSRGHAVGVLRALRGGHGPGAGFVRRQWQGRVRGAALHARASSSGTVEPSVVGGNRRPSIRQRFGVCGQWRGHCAAAGSQSGR